MSIQIEGFTFTGFPGRDAANLSRLSYAGRVAWLKHRFELVFLVPFREFIKLERPDCYIGLCVSSLLCSAVEALASLEFDDPRGHERFARFVETYFSPDFRGGTLALYDPKPARWTARTPAEHLYKYFRSGLAHSFCIEWGGLSHREDGAPSYLFEAGPGPDKSLGIVPRELVQDFQDSVGRFFRALESRGAVGVFQQRFEEVFLAKAGPPLP